LSYLALLEVTAKAVAAYRKLAGSLVFDRDVADTRLAPPYRGFVGQVDLDPIVRPKGGYCSSENRPALGLVLAWRFVGTVALPARLNTMILCLPSGDGICSSSTVSHAPKSSANDQIV